MAIVATWTKLKKENAWGLRIEGGPIHEGDVITVSRANGSKSRETVGKIVWTGNGVTLATLGPKPTKASKKAAPEAPKVPEAPEEYDYDYEESPRSEDDDLPY